MEKTTKILVPIDFSNCSKNALIYTIQIANEISANIQVLNVSSIDTSKVDNSVSSSVAIDEQISLARRRLSKYVQKVTENIHSTLAEMPSIQTSIKIGRIEDTIRDVAVKIEASYIIMGTQGENSTLDKYLGSVASNVLNNAPCPVMVIPENTEFEKKVVMVYATNFLDADPYEIWKAIKLFKPLQPQIKCVHFNEKQVFVEDKIKELETYFAETAPELEAQIYSLPVKDKVKDLNDFIEEHNINMLVMYKPKRSFFESIFHKSYTQKMAKHTNIPLLVFKEIK
ncbi:universal stress protein [Winogradskyella sp.]|uniref:universal stress protein n=1 Tax=Winogradskyella sp. TaxID=1883156 RepID=UPI003F6AB802